MRLPFLAVRTRTADETKALGCHVGGLVLPGDVLVLSGGLGTGKTTFIQGLGEGLDVVAAVRSPTYTMMHTYEGRYPLLHVDLYRCEAPQEVVDLGLEELMDAPRVTAIEWGEKASPILTQDYLELEFTWDVAHEDVRTISFRPSGRWRERMGELSDSVRTWAASGGG